MSIRREEHPVYWDGGRLSLTKETKSSLILIERQSQSLSNCPGHATMRQFGPFTIYVFENAYFGILDTCRPRNTFFIFF